MYVGPGSASAMHAARGTALSSPGLASVLQPSTRGEDIRLHPLTYRDEHLSATFIGIQNMLIAARQLVGQVLRLG